jgi:hypothetical protein
VNFHGAELICSTNLLVMKRSATSMAKPATGSRGSWRYSTRYHHVDGHDRYRRVYAQNGRVNKSLEVYAWDGSVRVQARLLSASWV